MKSSMDNPRSRPKIRMLIKDSIKRSQNGFTLIEITVVLVLMAIISAYVIGRSVTTGQADIVGQTDRIRNQIRFAQSSAMKQSNRIWGIKSDTTANQYWLFSVPIPAATMVTIISTRVKPLELRVMFLNGIIAPDRFPVSPVWFLSDCPPKRL